MKMSDKEVKRMLQKYMDGMTSVDEETRLAEYFSKAGDKAAPEGMAAEDWQAYKDMFTMFVPKRRKAVVVSLWRWVAAAVLVSVVAGSWVWFGRPAAVTNEAYVAVADKVDSTANASAVDTTAIEVVPQHEDMQPAKQPDKKATRLRHEPAVPRYYMAQATPPATDSARIDPEEALRQADLLMQAVYLQQQSDLNSAMMQCTLVIEEEEEAF